MTIRKFYVSFTRKSIRFHVRETGGTTIILAIIKINLRVLIKNSTVNEKSKEILYAKNMPK